jgi:ABC-type antimicrobial peptide transport system permease subunit
MPDSHQPSKWLLALFRWLCHPDYKEDLEGDLLERFEMRLKERGIKPAKRGLILDVLKLLRPTLMRSVVPTPQINPYDMYLNYFKISWRTLLKYRGFTLLNIAGLTLGVTSCLLIFSFVNFHQSFDAYHPENDRIFRFVTEQHRETVGYTPAITNPFGKVFREEFDLAEYVARVCTRDLLVTVNEKQKYEETVAFAEGDYFRILDLPLLKGSYESALSTPGAVILTESLAKKYFGDSDPVGKTLKIGKDILATVTGVLKGIPASSDFRTQLYISYSTLPQYDPWHASDDSWGGLSSSMQCFVRLRPGVTPEEVESAVSGYPERFRPGSHNRHVYRLQPIGDVHFSALYGGVLSQRNLNALMVIGFFLMIAACFNFINLATALNFRRVKEVGITKAIGGTRNNLFWRFIAETSIIALLSFGLAAAISRYSVDFINPWLGDGLRFTFLIDYNYLIFLPLLLLAVVFISGSYPGLLLARLSPIEALKGSFDHSRKEGYTLRKTLIVVQFSISQLLVISLIIMAAQMKYAQGDLGFTTEAVVLIPVGSTDEKMESIKNEILQLSGVDQVSACFASPASNENNWGTSVRYDNSQEPEAFNIQFKGADEDYLKTFDLELTAGRNLLPGDTIKEFIVNETFLKKMNIGSAEEVIGKNLSVNSGRPAPIVGVVRDFYDRSFREEKNAISITTSRDSYNSYAIRLSGENFQETIAAVQSLWTPQYPDQLFRYEFLDDQLAEFYATERVLVNIIKVFSFIAILIGCLGMLGLVSFMAANRKKEIAIRKVLGGSVAHILSIFTSEFIKLILIASLIAVPVGWWAMTRWLENFTYRISPEPWVFVTAIGASVVIAALTISFQSFKAAISNPVDSLRGNG